MVAPPPPAGKQLNLPYRDSNFVKINHRTAHNFIDLSAGNRYKSSLT